MAVPALMWLASATQCWGSIQFTYCSSGCSNSNSGMSYSAFQTAAAPFATVFTTPISFVGPGLNGSGIYTDATTGTVFTGYNTSQAQEPLALSGTSLAQTGSAGKDRSIGIQLPANTYAVGMFLSSTSGFASPYIVLLQSAFNLSGANYSVSLSSSSDSQFFGIVSDTPISSLFVGDLLSFQSPIRIQSFEIGTAGAMTETPEGSTFALIGIGLVVIHFLNRKRLRVGHSPAARASPSASAV